MFGRLPLFILTLATLPLGADLNYCNPTILKETNERFAATLVCSSMSTEHFPACIRALQSVGAGTFLAAMFAGSRGNGVVGTTAVELEMSRLRNYLNPETREILGKMIGRKAGLGETRQLISELQKHPRLYENHIVNFTRGARYYKLRGFLRATGAIAVALSLIENAVFTMPEDCAKLSWPGVTNEDKKWIDFGLNCSRAVDPKFFQLDFEEQVKVTQRSPDICKAISSFKTDLEGMYLRLFPKPGSIDLSKPIETKQ